MAEIVTTSRRHHRRDLLNIAAAAVAGVTGMKASPVSHTTADPVIDLLRQADELCREAGRLEDRACTMRNAAEAEHPNDPRLLDDAAAIEARSDALFERCEELSDRIDDLMPRTLAGAVALLEDVGTGDTMDHPKAQNAMAFLRDLVAAKGGAA